MRTNICNHLICALVLVGMLAGCAEKNEIDNPNGAGFNLARNLVEMPAEGGIAEVLYFIDSPIEGAEVSVDYDCEWIGEFDLSEDGKIKFNVQSQTLEVETRTSTVTVTYAEEEQQFTVSQSGNTVGIELKVVNTRATSFILSVTPKDPDMRFMCEMGESSIIDNMSDEELVASDMELLKEVAELNGKTFEEYISWYFDPVKGPKWMSPYCIYTQREPNTGYTAYAYGMGPDGNRLTPVYRVSTTTKDFVRENTTDFEVSTVNDGSGNLTVRIDPSDDDQWYYFGVTQYEWESITEENIINDEQNYFDSFFFMMMTDPANSEMPELSSLMPSTFYKGAIEKSVTLEYPKEGGLLYAFVVDDSARIVSKEVYMQEFAAYTTASDNRISISVTDITADGAKWSTVTTNDDPYVVCYRKTSDYQGLDGKAVIERLIAEQGIADDIKSSDASGEITGLEASTAYTVFAFGYEDGAATTDLVRSDFYTLAETEALSCRTVVVKYFDGTELANYDMDKYNDYHNKVVIVVDAVVTGNPVEYNYGLYNKRNSELEDSQLINLLTGGSPSVADTQPRYVFTANKMYYGSEMCLISVAVGQDGSYSPVERNFVTFTADGTSPAREFPELEATVQ